MDAALLNGPLLVLQMLHNVTADDSITERMEVLDTIGWLQQYTQQENDRRQEECNNSKYALNSILQGDTVSIYDMHSMHSLLYIKYKVRLSPNSSYFQDMDAALLDGPLLILQMLHNATIKDTQFPREQQILALDDIKWLEQHFKLETSAAETCNYVNSTLLAILQSDRGGCILYDAVRNRNIRAVELLLDKGSVVDGLCNGSGVLHAAVQTNDKNLTQLLLNRNCSITLRNSKGDTPLQLAARTGRLRAFKKLARECVLRRVKFPLDKNNNNVAHLAAAAGQCNILKHIKRKHKELLKQGNNKEETPLMSAAEKGKEECFKELFDPQLLLSEDKYGNTVLHKAAEAGREHIVSYIFNNSNDRYIQTDVHDCNAYAPCVTRLGGTVKGTCLLNRRNKHGRTPLQLALQEGQHGIVRLMSENGPNLCCRDNYDNTVLHFAAQGNHVQLMKVLVNNLNFDVDVQNNNKNTALHIAARANSREAAQFLLQKHASTDIQNTDRETALHMAAAEGAVDVVKCLVWYRARTDIKNGDQFTAQQITEDNNHQEIARILQGNQRVQC